MNILDKTDDEIIAIAEPIWDNLVKNIKHERLWWLHKRFWNSNVVWCK